MAETACVIRGLLILVAGDRVRPIRQLGRHFLRDEVLLQRRQARVFTRLRLLVKV